MIRTGEQLVTDMLPFSEASIRLSDGRIARVVKQHHASPRERWKMWKTLREVAKQALIDGDTPTRRKRFQINLLFLGTLLSSDCQACWYEWEETT